MTTTIPTPNVAFSPSPIPRTPSADDGGGTLPRSKPAANDVRPAQPDAAEYDRLLTDPRVRAFLWARLGPIRIRRGDKEDLITSVLDALWRRRTDRDPASTVPRMLGLAWTILQGKLVDYWRHADLVSEVFVDAPRVHKEDDPPPPRDKRGEQPTYVEDLRPPRSMNAEDALHAKQQMQYVNEVAGKIGLTDDDVEVMYAVTYDSKASYEELAAERGMTAGALRTRIHRLQKAVREGWDRRVKRTLILTLLLLAMLLLYVLAAIGPGRKAPPPPAPLPEPPVHEVAPVAPTATVTTQVPQDEEPRKGPKPR